jgi:hypothetical protein
MECSIFHIGWAKIVQCGGNVISCEAKTVIALVESCCCYCLLLMLLLLLLFVVLFYRLRIDLDVAARDIVQFVPFRQFAMVSLFIHPFISV